MGNPDETLVLGGRASAEGGARDAGDELLRTLKKVLADEREAVRRLDVREIARTNEAKEDILRQLRVASTFERPSLHAALDEVKSELYCNLTLLTQARAFLRERKSVMAAQGSNVIPIGAARRVS